MVALVDSVCDSVVVDSIVELVNSTVVGMVGGSVVCSVIVVGVVGVVRVVRVDRVVRVVRVVRVGLVTLNNDGVFCNIKVFLVGT